MSAPVATAWARTVLTVAVSAVVATGCTTTASGCFDLDGVTAEGTEMEEITSIMIDPANLDATQDEAVARFIEEFDGQVGDALREGWERVDDGTTGVGIVRVRQIGASEIVTLAVIEVDGGWAVDGAGYCVR